MASCQCSSFRFWIILGSGCGVEECWTSLILTFHIHRQLSTVFLNHGFIHYLRFQLPVLEVLVYSWWAPQTWAFGKEHSDLWWNKATPLMARKPGWERGQFPIIAFKEGPQWPKTSSWALLQVPPLPRRAILGHEAQPSKDWRWQRRCTQKRPDLGGVKEAGSTDSDGRENCSEKGRGSLGALGGSGLKEKGNPSINELSEPFWPALLSPDMQCPLPGQTSMSLHSHAAGWSNSPLNSSPLCLLLYSFSHSNIRSATVYLFVIWSNSLVFFLFYNLSVITKISQRKDPLSGVLGSCCK